MATFKTKYIDGEYKVFKNGKLVTKEDILGFLVEYSNKIGRFPVQNDFLSNPKYPSFGIYRDVFGSWTNTVKLAGLVRSPRKYNKVKYYNQTNTCDNIKKIGFSWRRCKRDLLIHGGLKEKDIKGNWTGKWICHNCYYHTDYKNRPDCSVNLFKSITDRRTGNLDPNSPCGKGDLFQELTCIWRSMVSITPVEDLNKKLDNYRTPIDHSRDSELGIIETKGAFYNSDGYWGQNFNILHWAFAREFIFDNVIIYCASEDGEYIERIYIIPTKEIEKRTSITIVKNPKDSWGDSLIPWYEKYRVKNEETIKKVNNIWNKIHTKFRR